MMFTHSTLKYFSIVFCLISCYLFIGCQQQKVNEIQGSAFGTYYSIKYIGDESTTISSSIDSILNNFSSTFSIFDTTSLLYQLNSGKEMVLSENFVTLFNKSQTISEATDGAFDPTIGPLVNVWGFGKEEMQHTVPQHIIDSILSFSGYKSVSIFENRLIKKDKHIQLNYNAIAKGYAVDKISEYLKQNGYVNCLVDIGGEVVASGTKYDKDWIIGIQTPTETADGAIETNYTFSIRDKAIATSGNYRNYFEKDGKRFTHIINPKTGYPETSSLLSVSVIAQDCATADAFATAFMVMGLENSLQFLRNRDDIEALFIYDHEGKYTITKTDGFAEKRR